jgi:glycosyl transferase family 2
MRVVAVTQTYERAATVRACLPAWARERDAAKAAGLHVEMHVHDDGSTDPAVREVGRACADAFHAHPHVVEKNRSWGIAQGVRRNLEIAVADPAVEWVYVCDSDTYPTPRFWSIAAKIVEAAGADAYSFFNSSWQAKHRQTFGRVWLGETSLLKRETCPGASFMMRASRLRELGYPFDITKENHAARGAWDFVLANYLKPVLVTERSLVEHFGAGGIHNAASFDIDRAVNPTKELATLRRDIIREITTRRKVGR